MAKAKKEKPALMQLDTFEERKQAVDAAVDQISKKYGEGAIMTLNGARVNVEALPTGCLSLDLALGVGGLPRGRICEIYGPESAGKTTVCLTMIAEEQKNGGICAFIDAEHAIDPVYAKNLGVNIDDLLLAQPDNGEQALDIVETLVNSNGVSLIVVDSVAALVPKSEIEGDIGDQSMGVHARLMSKAMRTLAPIANKTKCTILFTNQIREKIGFVLGNPETTPGGRALKFFASVRMEIRRKETIKDNKEEIGSRVKVKIVKNKVASPFRIAEFDIMYGTGIDRLGELADAATELDIIHKAGAWFSYNGDKVAQGRENLKLYLKENTELMESIKEQVIQKMSADDTAEEPKNTEPDEPDEIIDGEESDGFDVA